MQRDYSLDHFIVPAKDNLPIYVRPVATVVAKRHTSSSDQYEPGL